MLRERRGAGLHEVLDRSGNYGVYFRDTSVRLDTDTFEEIRQIALKRQCSFGAVIRDLVELGLETEKLGVES